MKTGWAEQQSDWSVQRTLDADWSAAGHVTESRDLTAVFRVGPVTAVFCSYRLLSGSKKETKRS